MRKRLIAASVAVMLGTVGIVTGALASDPAAQRGAIESLPKAGPVSISGSVDSVDKDQAGFVLKDNLGDRIKVNLANPSLASGLSAGNMVRVSGNLNQRFFGLSKKIEAQSVTRLNTTSSSH